MLKPEIVKCPECGALCVVVKGDFIFQPSVELHCHQCGNVFRR